MTLLTFFRAAPAAAAGEAAASPLARDAALRDQMQRLSQLRVFFGHQSVGVNLLDGLRTEAARLGVPLRIIEYGTGKSLSEPGIVHVAAGQNGDPLGKVHHFAALLDAGAGAQAQVAAVKLCYVDFSPATDPAALFEAVKKERAGMHARHPNLALLSVTAPLTTVQGGLKGALKNTFGSGAAGVRENVLRQRFNQLVRADAAATGAPLFDLAEAEAGSGVERCAFEHGGEQIPCLRPGITDDGGHLNARGRAEVAGAFAEALVAAAATLPPTVR